MNYIDCHAIVEVIKVKDKWQNGEVEFWKEEDYGWCFKCKGEHWNYGYESLKDAIIRYASSLAIVADPVIKITGSMLIDKNYEQANAWNRNDKGKKVSSINCEVVVRRFTA